MSVIHLIAPSGYCINQAAAARGIQRLEAAGHQVTHRQVVTRRFQRFAGTDAERLADIEQLAYLAPEVDIVLAVRGGYGASRLLEQIDFPHLGAALRAHPRIICGHSDFTAIQLGLLAQCGAITFSGPMLAGNFGAEEMDDFTWHHFWRALREPQFTLNWHSAGPSVRTGGTVWGGNLAMLISLIGTPWLPAIDDGILVLEDINEHPFRIERMLLQLHHAGILSRQRAIILGSFSATPATDYDAGYNFTEMCHLLSQRLRVPVLPGLAFGHEPQTVTLPLGAFGELESDGCNARLTLSGHPILG